MPPQPVHISRTFTAPPERLYEAWLDPELAARWLFKSESNRIRVSNDRRVGGSFYILEHDGGQEIEHFGTYLELEDARRIVLTLEVPKHFAGMTRVTIELAPCDGGAAMVFTQTGVPREVTEESWRRMFEALARVLST